MSPPVSPVRRRQLYYQLRQHHISHAQVAATAGVTPSMVTKVLRGTAVSARVVAVIEDILAMAQEDGR